MLVLDSDWLYVFCTQQAGLHILCAVWLRPFSCPLHLWLQQRYRINHWTDHLDPPSASQHANRPDNPSTTLAATENTILHPTALCQNHHSKRAHEHPYIYICIYIYMQEHTIHPTQILSRGRRQRRQPLDNLRGIWEMRWTQCAILV